MKLSWTGKTTFWRTGFHKNDRCDDDTSTRDVKQAGRRLDNDRHDNDHHDDLANNAGPELFERYQLGGASHESHDRGCHEDLLHAHRRQRVQQCRSGVTEAS